MNTRADLDLCAQLGVEAVITDDPGMALDHFDGPSTYRPGGLRRTTTASACLRAPGQRASSGGQPMSSL